jgi:hypothetical protein
MCPPERQPLASRAQRVGTGRVVDIAANIGRLERGEPLRDGVSR